MEEIFLLNVKIYKYSQLGYCHLYFNSLPTLSYWSGTFGDVHSCDYDIHREWRGKVLKMKIDQHIKIPQKFPLFLYMACKPKVHEACLFAFKGNE